MVIAIVLRFIITCIFIVIYSISFSILIISRYLIHKLKNIGRKTPPLVKPSSLTDPQYGVHKFIKANNVNLHYVESGDPSKPLMLFIHGFPEFWYSWRHQIVAFNKDYYCVAIDMRGYGDSDKPRGTSSYKLDILVEDVRDFIQKLGRNKCILVSHDWGGIVASKFRDTHPDYLYGLMMFASVTKEAWHRDIWTRPNQYIRSWYTFLFLVPKLPEWLLELAQFEMFEFMLNHGTDVKAEANTIDCYKYVFRKSGSLTGPINYYRAVASFTYSDKYIDNNVPMLVANAEKDTSLLPNLLKSIKAEYKYIETMLVKDVDHFYQEQEPETVIRIMREFLAKHKL